jgi:hypothetical protein
MDFDCEFTKDGFEYHVELNVDFEATPFSPATYSSPAEGGEIEIKSVILNKIIGVYNEDGQEVQPLLTSEQIVAECELILGNEKSDQHRQFSDLVADFYSDRY